MKRPLTYLLTGLLFVCTTSFYSNSKSSFYILVDKTDYEMHVYDAQGWLATYPIVFGNKDLGDKLYEGDRRTPEGTFTIIAKRPHNKWHRYIALDYPTKESYEKFHRRKAQGLIPASARVGGDIGIHGTWPREDYAIDRYDNWTLGCISLKNEHVQQLYSIIPIGTKITIRH